jgi:hypothetical protein
MTKKLKSTTDPSRLKPPGKLAGDLPRTEADDGDPIEVLHRLEGEQYRLLGCKGKAVAMNLIQEVKT